MRDILGSYLETLFRATRDAECTGAGGERMSLGAGSIWACDLCHDSHNSGGKVMFIGNDFGYADVFSRQIEWHGGASDVLIAISSSGESANILKGVRTARLKGSRIVTF